MIASPEKGGEGKVVVEIEDIAWCKVRREGKKVIVEGEENGVIVVHSETEEDAEQAKVLVGEKIDLAETAKGGKLRNAIEHLYF